MAAVIEEKSFRGFYEIVSSVCLLAAVFCFVSLATFNPDDGGWTHSGYASITHNTAGIIGAWVADMLFTLFGFVAYLFPLLLSWQAFNLYRRRRFAENHLSRVFRWLGCVTTFIAGTVIFYLHVPRFMLELPNGSGGILGQEIGDTLLYVFTESSATILSSSIFILGIAFFAQFSWLPLIDAIGHNTLKCFTFLLHPLIVATRTPPAPPATKKSKKNNPSAENSTKPPLIVNGNAKKTSFLRPFKKATVLPQLSLLDKYPASAKCYTPTELEKKSRLVEQVLLDFNIETQVVAVYPGPVITRFELQLAAGVKVSKITSLAKDLARSLSVAQVRVVEVIQGKPVIGLEIPNAEREIVSLSDLLVSPQFVNAKSPLTLALGKDISGVPVVADLAKMPHVLVAGTTGSGKSVTINTMILSILYKSTPEQVRLIMIDPKMLELSIYEGIPHLLIPVVTDMQEAHKALKWAVDEMERRYKMMSKMGVRNLSGYNQRVTQLAKQNKHETAAFLQSIGQDDDFELSPLPRIVILIDELADMMMMVGKKVEEPIARLAQKARAAGIHLILATQRPSVDVLTGLIKANIPSRISFQVSSGIDSRTILDQSGAEALLGNGDMLFLLSGMSIPLRAHGAFVDDHEVHRVVNFFKQQAAPNYASEILADMSATGTNANQDILYSQVVTYVIQQRKVSTSAIQRHFKIGYNRAAKLVETLETSGIITRSQYSGEREVAPPAALVDDLPF